MIEFSKSCSVITFSGGKDSTALLLKMLEHQYHIDYILYCNTGAEFPEIEHNIQLMNKYLEKYNLSITTLKAEYNLVEYMTIFKRSRGIYKGLPYTFPSGIMRWCTGMLKLRPMRKFLQSYDKITYYIGYSANEVRRYNNLLNKANGNITYKAPLITDFKMTEQDCLKYCYSKGFTFEGIYKYKKRVSCFCCPYQRMKDYYYLWKHRPELWNKIKEIECLHKSLGITQWKFTQYRSTNDFEKIFKQWKKEEENILF